MRRVLLAAPFLLLPLAAHAQDASPTGPCVRGPSSVKMAGVDATELRCEVAVLQTNQAQAVISIAKLQTQLEIAKNDLVAATRARGELAGRVAELERQCGDACAKPAPK